MLKKEVWFRVCRLKNNRRRYASPVKKCRRDISRVMCHLKDGVCHLSNPRGRPLAQAAYPPAMDGQSLTAGIFGLATHGMCGLPCRQGSRWALTPPFHPYLHSGRRLFSVTYPRRRRRLPVRKHGALCCPDFPLEDPVFKRQTTLLRKAFRCVQPCLFFALAKEIIMSAMSSSLMLEASIER